MLKIAEVKLLSCELQKQLQLWNNISLKTCGIAIADSKKVARAHLCSKLKKGLKSG
jgi:hypothetical protein